MIDSTKKAMKDLRNSKRHNNGNSTSQKEKATIYEHDGNEDVPLTTSSSSGSSTTSSPHDRRRNPNIKGGDPHDKTKQRMANDRDCYHHSYDNDDVVETIGLFGLDGPTGQHFCKQALEAGYHVQALSNNPAVSQALEPYQNLTLLADSTIQDADAVYEVIHRSTYVVCLLGDLLLQQQKARRRRRRRRQRRNLSTASSSSGNTKKRRSGHRHHHYQPNTLLLFVKRIMPLMRESSTTRFFLFQASSLSSDLITTSTVASFEEQSGFGNIHHKTPILARLVSAVLPTNKRLMIQDQNAVIDYLADQYRTMTMATPPTSNANTNDGSNGDDKHDFTSALQFIVTRPGPLRHGASRKYLTASKSLPGPFPVTYHDLADFTLRALQDPSLYNKAPYVVGDGLF